MASRSGVGGQRSRLTETKPMDSHYSVAYSVPVYAELDRIRDGNEAAKERLLNSLRARGKLSQ